MTIYQNLWIQLMIGYRKEQQEGMLGVALDSNFKKNRTLFLYSTSSKYHDGGCKKDNFASCHGNIVMKFTVAKDFKSVSNRVDIVKDIQFKPFKSDQPFGGPGAHNGGRIRIGPDGYLWVGTGDRHMGRGPQDKNMLAGKVLRIDGDGNGHPGNKIDGDKRIYTYGHRNVQGIDFRPSDGIQTICNDDTVKFLSVVCYAALCSAPSPLI
jgi:glucose/arabinose dehydrogenase